jgi:amino acid adenylation domain-containing protein
MSGNFFLAESSDKIANANFFSSQRLPGIDKPNPGVTMSRCVHQLFEEQVARDPHRVALSLHDDVLSYGDLNRRADLIAATLESGDVKNGDLVGVFLERSFELIASILAILKVGAAYVPLDVNYPPERLSFMVADAGMKVILSTSTLAAAIPPSASRVVCLDAGGASPAVPAPSRPAGHRDLDRPDQLAYVMYTSGSTGTPKGVAIPHRGIVRLVREPDFVRITPEDVFLQISPVSFDASTLEIWGPLVNGARLVLMPPGQPSLRAIGETIRRNGVSILWLSAGLFNLMVDERLQDLRPIRQQLVGGDVLSVPHILRALAGLPETRLINGYGPTENTTFTCCYAIPRDLPSGKSVPIGRPIRGTTIHIVDEDMREVPAGQAGELVTGGLGLAQGYWNRPQLTAECFVPDPFAAEPGARLYRTGDQVRLLPDGNVEFLGRRDSQVKIRGFRIELGEIETVIREHPGVSDCAIKVLTDTLGNKSLAAYVIAKDSRGPSSEELRAYAEARLPEFMVPTLWAFLDRLPLNPNGKVDRSQLPSAGVLSGREAQELPANDLEKRIADIWQDALGRPVGVTGNFFDLGGNSLLLTQVHERLGRWNGSDLPLTDLFRFPTIRSLAAHMQSRQAGTPASGPSTAERNRLRRSALDGFKRK